jgi:hypothetical protein
MFTLIWSFILSGIRSLECNRSPGAGINCRPKEPEPLLTTARQCARKGASRGRLTCDIIEPGAVHWTNVPGIPCPVILYRLEGPGVVSAQAETRLRRASVIGNLPPTVVGPSMRSECSRSQEGAAALNKCTLCRYVDIAQVGQGQPHWLLACQGKEAMCGSMDHVVYRVVWTNMGSLVIAVAHCLLF